MKALVVAPHPDDEILGLGGTLLRKKQDGTELALVIVTEPSMLLGWDLIKLEKRKSEIQKSKSFFNFSQIFDLQFPSAGLDKVGDSALVASIADVFHEFRPDEIYIPHYSDVHGDHRFVFHASISASKSFRCDFIKRIYAYETLSETEFNVMGVAQFRPNFFVDISCQLEEKIEALEIYSSEMNEFPFPRSEKAVRALAELRGSTAGFLAAEAFELLRERVPKDD